MTQRKSEILIPKGDFARARITARRAPQPKIDAGIGGWIEWQLIDRQGRVARGGEQHNLFLNQGLDLIATSPLHTPSWFTHAAVGTGSSTPDAADTALDSELSRTSTFVPGQDSTVRSSPGVYELSRQWEFGFAVGNGNLSEWGIARAGTGQLAVRELFRDAGGTPIVITKTSDYQLRIRYTCRISLSPTTVTAASFSLSGIGLVSGTISFKAGQSNAPNLDLRVFGLVASASTVSGTQQGRCSASPQVHSTNYEGSNILSGVDTNRQHSTFTPGVWQRSVTPHFATGDANSLIATLAVIGHDFGITTLYPGFVFAIDEDDRFVKDNEHTLTINDLLTVTWGRA